ncbi:hypothetical protein F0562_034270 [Nyssa sinensis]|uniref:Nucleotide-diphospho-sugar transferase domain-containing protein n=1 Tax=Nyssa sinensis TaxID=561372 RepID=A0A5J5AGA3_9ASTE|nr:hypothetical protein F0562_034270 [Nyssa sinensis]
MKEPGIKSGEKAKESDSRKKSTHPDGKEDRKETERDRRASAKEYSNRKRERGKDEKGERSRHKHSSESSRHKRHRSSSVGSRGRNSKDNSVVSHANDSSDEASDDSRRKLNSKKRNLSPSPISSRRRQVSRSPHSKHSQRRHSPYSSLERSRGRRSRSRSPSSATAMEVSSLLSPFCSKKKAFQAGLWSVWLCGLFLIAVSFYATQRLSSSIKNQISNPKLSDSPKITIFTAPSPFTGSVGARQSLAVRSWLGLSPDITVVLFSQDPSAVFFAGGFGSRVSIEPNIDFTFLNTPFFHSMVARIQASTSDISVLIDPETILLPDFIPTLNHAYKLDHEWLLVASSRHVSDFPFNLDADGKHWLAEDGKRIRTQKLQEFFAQTWQWKHCEGRMLMAWNNQDLPLHGGILPPFLFGKGLHNHWIINEALSSGFRFVFDASWTISNLLLNDLDHESYQSVGGSDSSDSKKRSWEIEANSLLGALYGSLYFHEANYSNLVKFYKCEGHYIFMNTVEDIVYPLRHQRSLSIRKERILVSRKEKKILDCADGIKSLDGIGDCSVKDQLKSLITLSLPFSLDFLLSVVADHNKTIVLAVAGYSYKDILMSWVCRLRHLRISNFLVCALDHEIYDFSVLQGLPVFKDSFAPTNISFNDCHFGTKCFQRVTKVKSRVVLQILKLGYNVLLSDIDIYWFKNPLPLLYSFGPAVLVAQSDEYNTTGPINLPRRLNSGFYYARSDASTIAALEKVVKHAVKSNLSEQPSFYDTLCGEGGSNRVGDDRCLEPETNLTVHFLNRDFFPNGAYQGLWEEKNVKEACVKKGCFILHNNWISGRRRKLERQRCAQLLGLGRKIDRESRLKNLEAAAISLDLSIQLKDITVRIIHAGGREELYKKAIPASQLLEKYPGMCVARPEVFKNPHESLLLAEDKLLPGNKYYIIPSTTVKKLKRKHEKAKAKARAKEPEPAEDEEPMLYWKVAADISVDYSEESVCSAKDYYVSRERWSRCLLKKCRKEKKPFVPPIQKPKMWRGLGWEPSLNSVKELSP